MTQTELPPLSAVLPVLDLVTAQLFFWLLVWTAMRGHPVKEKMVELLPWLKR